MLQEINEDIECVIFCLIIGFLLKASYDIFKIIYKIIYATKMTQFIGDVIFFVCGAFGVFQIMLQNYYGVFRGFSVISFGIGAILHKLIVRDTLVNFITGIIFYIDSKCVRKLKVIFVKIIKKPKGRKSKAAKGLKKYHRCSKISLSHFLMVKITKKDTD